MSSLPGHSRRALVAATAVLAAAPVAEAKKKGKKKKKKPAPLASAVAAVVSFTNSGTGTDFVCDLDVAYHHPASGDGSSIGNLALIPFTAVSDNTVRAKLVASVQVRISELLESSGHDVPEDRIAVTLL